MTIKLEKYNTTIIVTIFTFITEHYYSDFVKNTPVKYNRYNYIHQMFGLLTAVLLSGEYENETETVLLSFCLN